VGLFGAIRRETKGAFRSLGYDLRQSKRFKRIGVIAVATVAGGVIATGALLREPVPGLAGGEGEDAGIIEGWLGLGSDTTGQDAEASESASETPIGEAADPSAGPVADDTESQSWGGGMGNVPADPQGLVPIGGDETSGPSEEEEGTASPPPSGEPTEEPTTVAPTEEPTDEPTTDAPTTEAPTESVSPTGGEDQTVKTTASAPKPQKAPVRA